MMQEIQEHTVNPGFNEIGKKFVEKGWRLKVNCSTRLEFQSATNEYDAFEFEIDQKAIYVSVPLKESKYTYCAKFSDYFSACDFAEMHLSNY